MTTVYVCECGNEFRLDEDKRYQYLDGTQRLFTGCSCGRGKDALMLVEEV
jgi:hypothetical protein